MALRPRLRVHLVGQSDEEKLKLAKDLRAALNRQRGRMDCIIVPPLADRVRDRFPEGTHHFFLALESEYMRYETSRDTKAKHLLFLDSLVDRYVRTQDAKTNLDVFFHPRMETMAAAPGHVCLYGPQFDDRRSALIAHYGLPVQAWTDGRECIPAMVEAVCMRIRRRNDFPS